jgi:transcriptional regulator with XRE-family HTH domain
LGLKPYQLPVAAGLSPSAIQQFESGITVPLRPSTVLRLAAALELDPRELAARAYDVALARSEAEGEA